MLINIVIRTKDRPLFLERAIKSVLSQSCCHWHCVIVNDGGGVSAVEKVIVCCIPEDLRDSFSIIHNEKSNGMEAASNQGLRHKKADYYIIHDDDDSWSSCFLETCVENLSSASCESIQGVVARTLKIEEKVMADGSIRELSRSPFLPEVTAFTIPRIVQNNPFMPIAFLYTHKAVELLQGYDETLPVVGDWEFNLRFIRHFDIAYEPCTTAYYHVRPNVRGDSSDNSISRSNQHKHFRMLVMNRFIRQEMNKGTLSLGHLMAASEPGLHANRLGEKLGTIVPRFRTKLNLKSLVNKWLKN